MVTLVIGNRMNRQDRRRKRLNMLISEAGSQVQLAELVGSPPAFISQMVGKKRAIGNAIASRLEAAMRKPDGWMDQWLPDEGGWNGVTRHKDWFLFDKYEELPQDMRKAIRESIISASKLTTKRQKKKKTGG